MSAPILTSDTAAYLTTSDGSDVIARASALTGDAADRVLALRKRGLDREIAAGAVEIAVARRRARGRFADSDHLFFTSEALAQATSPEIARYHASRLASLGTIADLGCGLGMDSIALAEAGASHVIAIERDPVRLIFARANARIRGVADRVEFVEGDVTLLDWSADAVYWDPSRRERDGHRVSNFGDRYEPPLSFLEKVKEKAARGGCVKLSPGLPDDTLTALGGSVAFLSEGRECKEACLWFGEASTNSEPAGSAVLLPENIVLEADRGDADDQLPSGPLGDFVFDPDPAVIRAGALRTLSEKLQLHLVSQADSYLTGSRAASHRAVFCYKVIHAMPYRARELSSWLRGHEIGRLVIKKRHFPREPDAMARELRLKGDGREATLILVRRDEGGHEAIICEPHREDADL